GTRAVRPADRSPHGQGSLRGGRDPAAQDGGERDLKRRTVAGATARRDVTLPPPRRVGAAAVEAGYAEAPAPDRRGAGRKEGARRRRRRAQHLRADEPSRTARA